MSLDWIVIGWYTPDYEHLANKLSQNLLKYKHPNCFYPVPKQEKWNTQRKPSVVLRAMHDFPAATLVLMDVDCTVNEDISEITKFDGDVSMMVRSSYVKGLSTGVMIKVSSRIIVFKPTDGANKFAQEWQRQIDLIKYDDLSYNGDEKALAQAFIRSTNVKFHFLPKKFSARSEGSIPGALITHDSEHEKRSVKGLMRRLEKRFLRTGKSRQEKLATQLGE